MRPIDQERARELEQLLIAHSQNFRPLPGIAEPLERRVLIEQLLESIRRVEFIKMIQRRDISPLRSDPTSDLFDPLRSAIIHWRLGNTDEAFWLVFLSIHFGKHQKDGWRLARDVYGCLSGNERWTWDHISTQPAEFEIWLANNAPTLRNDGTRRRFGGHRSYQSLRTDSNVGTAEVFRTYIEWVAPPRTHLELLQTAQQEIGENPKELFNWLYCSMDSVIQFGRLAKFDYLAMLGKLGMAPIEPDSAYLGESTGPIKGARLLFSNNHHANTRSSNLDAWLIDLDSDLNLGMQVLEDALCNWQKSPSVFVAYR